MFASASNGVRGAMAVGAVGIWSLLDTSLTSSQQTVANCEAPSKPRGCPIAHQNDPKHTISEKFQSAAYCGDFRKEHRGTIGVSGMSSLPFTQTLIERESFTALYDHRLRIPIWVLENLTKETVSGPGDRKGVPFVEDPLIPSMWSATNKSYWGTGYSRGHMAAAGAHKQTQQAIEDTFHLSNILPQDLSNNGGDWYLLEMMTREMAIEGHDVVVLNGALFLPGRPRPVEHWPARHRLENDVMGPDFVHAPSHLFKVVVATKGDNVSVSGFVQPNVPYPADYTSRAVEFQVPVGTIAYLSGIDFSQVLAPVAKALLLAEGHQNPSQEMITAKCNAVFKQLVEQRPTTGNDSSVPLENLRGMNTKAGLEGWADYLLPTGTDNLFTQHAMDLCASGAYADTYKPDNFTQRRIDEWRVLGSLNCATSSEELRALWNSLPKNLKEWDFYYYKFVDRMGYLYKTEKKSALEMQVWNEEKKKEIARRKEVLALKKKNKQPLGATFEVLEDVIHTAWLTW